MDKLIDNQTIDFDTHQAGSGEEILIDGLHMHKRINGKRGKGVSVIFPLYGKSEIVFRPRTTKNKLRQQILNEIKNVLKKNHEKRDEFVMTIIDEIKRYSNGLPEEKKIDNIKKGASKIAKIFSKNDEVKNEIMQIVKKRIKFIITSHLKNNGKLFFIKQDFMRNRIKIGDDLELINYGNNKSG